MSDLISRQAAIDALHTRFRDGFDKDRWWNSTHVLAAIEGLPSAQQRWIPVTERLPEEDGTYIVCLDDRSVFEYDYISKWWDDDAWQYCGEDVVAWMPLPEPYKEEKDE